jgi:hypothetical protein
MPTRKDMRLDLAVIVGVLAAASLLRLWAARHSTQTGVLATAADAVNVAI